jgi:hypothetical protein
MSKQRANIRPNMTDWDKIDLVVRPRFTGKKAKATFSLDAELFAEFRELCSGVNMSYLIELMMSEYVEHVKKRSKPD